MGERPEGRARTGIGDGVTPDGAVGQREDIDRIAGAVRRVTGARAALVSRVVDDEWLEVVSVAGDAGPGDQPGRRWRRTELERRLALVTDESPGGLLAPLRTASGVLLGVLSTDGPVARAALEPTARELIEAYAEQARLALSHLAERELLAEQLRLAFERDAYRRDLVVSITHDLKTPLTAIALNTELLASGERLEDAGHHPVDAIRRSAQRLSGLVDDLLALARTEERQPHADDAVEDLVSVLYDACRHAEPEAQLRGISFEIEAPDKLAVPVDADALSRVFVNVVANAVKFSLPNGQVRLVLARVGDIVEFTCADSGIGISEEDQPAVFDMFSRSRDPLARGLPGNGMGLAISQRILARLGGSIEVRSVQGEGSTFVVRVPIDASA